MYMTQVDVVRLIFHWVEKQQNPIDKLKLINVLNKFRYTRVISYLHAPKRGYAHVQKYTI